MRPFPARPRLAEHALARWHVAAGEELVLVHDTRTGGTLRLGPREWGLLAAADGTRDLEGIVLAAARAGAHARVPALRAFLEHLHGAGLLEDGLVERISDPSVDASDEDRALEALPGFTLRCDGRGSCCRIYASVVVTPLEAVRARAALPLVRDGGADPYRAFTPERGSAPGGAHAIALAEGRCAYLEGSGRCGIHAAAGAEQKPLGCRLYPATFVDDGEAVRISVAVECACVLASVGATDGEPLVSASARRRRDLPAGAFVARLPERVALTPTVSAARAELRAWSRAILAAPEPTDGVAAYWSLAAAIERGGLEPRMPPLEAPRSDAIAPWIAALAKRAERRALDDGALRSDQDLARLATRWIAAAAGALRDPELLRAGLAADGGAGEAFHLRATVHGHHLVSELPLASALRDRAVRLLIARAMGSGIGGEGDEDPAAAHPLPLVDAMLRGHGLDAYAHDLGA